MIWLIVALALLALVFGPTLWVRWVMQTHAVPIEGMPGTGGELAQHLIDRFGLQDVGVEETAQGDHYDPEDRMVRLSPDNYGAKSLTAVAVAAHEVGHALQHHRGDRRLAMRTRLIPVADQLGRISSGVIWAAPFVAILTRHPMPFSLLTPTGLSGMLARMLVHAVTLPIELDASFNKALPVLAEGYVSPDEQPIVRRVLRAAALTYVAAALADVLNLARWAAILLRR